MKKTLMAVVLFICVLGFSPKTHAVYSNSVGVFGGAKSGTGKTHLAVGLEFEHSLMPLIGFAVFAEKVLVTPSEMAFGAGLAVHPIPMTGFKFVGMPGVEISGGKKHFMFRVGGLYEFSLGPIFAGPAVYLDFVGGHMPVVYGLVVGIGI